MDPEIRYHSIISPLSPNFALKSVTTADLVKSGLTDRVVNDAESLLVSLQLTEH